MHTCRLPTSTTRLAPRLGLKPTYTAAITTTKQRRTHPQTTGIAVALEPQLADLDDATLLLVLNSYRIAGHPSSRALAAAALPLLRDRAQGLSCAQLVQAARLYAPMSGQRFAVGSSGGRDQSDGKQWGVAGGSGAGVEGVDELLKAVDAAASARAADF